MLDSRIVVVGAGHAGGAFVHQLRQFGHTGPITMVGEESLFPYQRPPLSKAWLKGEADGDSLALRPGTYYETNGIEVRRSVSVSAIDSAARAVDLSDGSRLEYDNLVLATGARAIRLPVPGADLAGVHVLRSADDAEALKARIGQGRTIAVIGGGYIGLEVAASAIALGGSAVVIEREERLLARSGSEPIAAFFRRYHEDKGVAVMLGAQVVGFVGENGVVTGVSLASGEVVACDTALMGVGIRPDDQLAAAAGLACDRGVLVDHRSKTSVDGIFAIGDCARRPMPLYNDVLFSPESVPNALEQAKQAAATIVGRAQPAAEVPWNWSDQYELKLQMAGLPFGIDEVVVRGDPALARFAVFHLSEGRIRQVEAVNSGPEFLAGRQLIASGKKVDVQQLGDPSVSLREIIAQLAAV